MPYARPVTGAMPLTRFGRSCPSRHPGFTLIELLVVISIIAMLISILLPSLSAARRQARQVVCTMNLKNISTTSRVYGSDDVQGWAIPVHPLQVSQCPGQKEGESCDDPIFVGAYEWGGKSGIGRDAFLTGSPGNPLNSKYGAKAGFGASTRPLNSLLYPGGFTDPWASPRFDRVIAQRDTQLELDAFRCPSDDGPPGGAHCPDWVNNIERSSYDHFGNSYAANLFMIWAGSGGRLGPGWDAGEMGSNSPYMRPTSRIVSPARTLYYEENIGRWAWATRRENCDRSRLQPGVDPGRTKTIRGWHKADWTFNRSFVDGHAESQKVFLAGTEDEEGYSLHYRYELIFPTDADKEESMRCVIIRGDGWQKDTLPSDFIRTGLLHIGSVRASYEDCVSNE